MPDFDEALYLRVSTPGQVDRWSLPAQEHALIECATRAGHTYRIYRDEGISGETLDARPSALRMVEDGRAGKFRIARAVEMERFSRSESLFDWLVIKQAFREGKVLFGTPAQLYDPADEEDDFLTDLFGALSKREKRKFLARTLRSKLAAARAGRVITSHAPYGYKKVPGGLEVDDREAEVVRLIFSLLLEGNGSRTIARILSNRGIMPRDPRRRGRTVWAPSSVKRILRNPAYTGRWSYNKLQRMAVEDRKTKVLRPRPESEWIAIPIPRIVSDEIFALAQQRLRENSALARRHQKRLYMLKTKVRCGGCGRPMPGDVFHGVRYHRCIGRRGSLCSTKAVQAEPVEILVRAQITRVLRQPAVVLMETRKLMEARWCERDDSAARLAAAERALSQAQEKRERVLTLYREGEITRAELAAHLGAIEQEQDRVTAERDWLQGQMEMRTVDEARATRLEAAVARVEGRLGSLAPEEWFQLAQAFVERVVIHPDGRIESHLFIPVPDPKPEERTAVPGMRPRRADVMVVL